MLLFSISDTILILKSLSPCLKSGDLWLLYPPLSFSVHPFALHSWHLSILLFSLDFWLDFSFLVSSSPSLPSFHSSLHCHTVAVKHELMGRYWCVILPQRRLLLVCHTENEEKDGGARGQTGCPHPQSAVFKLSWCWHSHFVIPPASYTTFSYRRHAHTPFSLFLGTPEICSSR